MDQNLARDGFVILSTVKMLEDAGMVTTKKTPRVNFDWKNGLYFTMAAIKAINEKFGKPAPYARVGINTATKQISIEPAEEKGPETRSFMAGKEKQKNIIIRWSDDTLMGFMKEMLPDANMERVVMPMRYDEEAQWFVIEVGEAVESTRKRNKASGIKGMDLSNWDKVD